MRTKPADQHPAAYQRCAAAVRAAEAPVCRMDNNGLYYVGDGTAFLERSSLQKNMALAISIGFIFWNMWVIGENLTFSFIAKQKTINSPDFVASMSASAQKMDKGILEEIVRKYRH